MQGTVTKDERNEVISKLFQRKINSNNKEALIRTTEKIQSTPEHLMRANMKIHFAFNFLLNFRGSNYVGNKPAIPDKSARPTELLTHHSIGMTYRLHLIPSNIYLMFICILFLRLTLYPTFFNNYRNNTYFFRRNIFTNYRNKCFNSVTLQSRLQVP